MAYEVTSLSDMEHVPAVWTDIVNNSPTAWFWTTYAMHQFRVEATQASGGFVADRSFLLTADGRPCGLSPLVLTRDPSSGLLAATYADAPLSWPMAAADARDRAEVEDALLDEMERRIEEAGAGYVKLMLAPPGNGEGVAERFQHIVRHRRFVDTSFPSHVIEVTPDITENIRERYRRYMKKHNDDYEISTIAPDEVPHDFERTYMDIHTKDAGRVVRPLETYRKQIDLLRCGEGFGVVARNKAANRAVGILLVALHKQAAYDSSVAVDPEFQSHPVSNFLKRGAVKYLEKCGVRHYELGRAALAPSYLWQPTGKNYGISFFKDGWSRGHVKTVYCAEKFYALDSLQSFWGQRLRDLTAHFGLGGPSDAGPGNED